MVHRSQQDKAAEGEEAPSEFVLIPSGVRAIRVVTRVVVLVCHDSRYRVKLLLHVISLVTEESTSRVMKSDLFFLWGS